MKEFKYIKPTTVDEVSNLLVKYKGKAKVLAGGTSLIGTIKDEIHSDYPELIISLNDIKDLSYIREDSIGLKIGAMTRLCDMEKNLNLKEKYPALTEATHKVASPNIRNIGTIGGNICQEVRCWYYRNSNNRFPCIRKGGNECYALFGENQYHSIYGAARLEVSPCSKVCPANTDIPAYLEKIREGDINTAAKILLKYNPIPAITGRICPGKCEDDCNRGEFDDVISIRGVERFMGDYILENAEKLIAKPVEENGLKVAIIGSGPAGLSAAYYLRQYGYAVTVFEKMEKCGGMLTYGIPAYRLSKNVVESIIKSFENIGINFKTKMEVGKDILFERLKKDSDSIFVATGAWEQPRIGLEGEKYTKSGLKFLTNINLCKKKSLGKKVVVIGGGNVACDVSRSALRLGAEEVIMVCLECPEEMPALECEKEYSVEEGVKIINSWGPRKVLIIEDGKVKGIELVKCVSVFDENGNFSPVFDYSTKKTIEADQIYMAIGQKTDISFIDHNWGLNLLHSFIQVDGENQQTNVEGLFAGGDVASGPATAVEAICSGRKAADAINKYLGGKGKAKEKEEISSLGFNTDYLKKMERVQIKEIPVHDRKINIEDVYGLSQIEIEKEANRCFNCGCLGVSSSDIAPALIVLDATIKTTKRSIIAENFFKASLNGSTCLDQNEIVTEVILPPTKLNTKQTYTKFALRKSIDFPIIGVAVQIIYNDDGKINDARIAMNGVAPIPIRAKLAEDFLKGKMIEENVAEEAATFAVKPTRALAKNAYKIQITKALVKRAILKLIQN